MHTKRDDMARKKKLTPEQELEQYRDCLMEEFERWGEIKMHGCNDPCFTDGQNLNEAKSNIIWYRLKIHEICVANGLLHPPEYHLTVPPEAPAGYMASLDQTERVERLWDYGYGLTTGWG